MIGIGQQGDGEAVTLAKFSVRFDAIFANSQNNGIERLIFGLCLGKTLGLKGSAGRIVLWIKVEDDLATAEIA